MTAEQGADAKSVAARLQDEALIVDVEGFEGPLDLLLTLSRQQKVDLRRVSVLQLAEQYLRFVEAARKLRIELAADYLVMAAWLAYLKSRLLLPAPPGEPEPSGAEMAEALAFQLRPMAGGALRGIDIAPQRDLFRIAGIDGRQGARGRGGGCELPGSTAAGHHKQ